MQRHDLPVTRRGDLTDEQWERIYPYLPVGRKGRPFDNVRDTVNGILRILRHSAGSEKGGLIHSPANISE